MAPYRDRFSLLLLHQEHHSGPTPSETQYEFDTTDELLDVE
jgi:hypothetical protein